MIRLAKALNQFRHIRTADEKDRLQYVFGTIAAMGPKRYNKTRSKYLTDGAFCKMLKARPTLTDMLTNLDALEAMPKHSLGHALFEYLSDDEIDYAKFLSQYETAGLQASGGLYEAYNNRERDLHDLIHVLFGYSRTRFGEAATISTQFWQGGPSGFAVIAFAGVLRYLFVRPRYGLLVLRALWSAWWRQRGVDLRSYPFEYNLHKPLTQIRTELGIGEKSAALCQVLRHTRWED